MEQNQKPADRAVAAKTFTNISIESDGTAEGTKILINGTEVKNLTDLSFSLTRESYYQGVGLCYSISDQDKAPGTLASRTRFCLIPPDAKQSERGVASIREVADGDIADLGSGKSVDTKNSVFNVFGAGGSGLR
jgi:hypothetical protein